MPEQQAETIVISRRGTHPSQPGPVEYFTGSVRVDRLFGPTDVTQAAGASVTFAAGARTAWHTHPRGQTLIVTDGVGRVQRWGGAIQEMHHGDVVWIPAGEKHWHGAAPETAMTHLAIHEHLDGVTVDWLEHVSDEQYRG